MTWRGLAALRPAAAALAAAALAVVALAVVALAVVALAVVAATALARPAWAAVPSVEEALPVPPIPPDEPPGDVAAPVPNINLFAPQSPQEEGTRLQPTLNERVPILPGADPVPGSLYRSDQEQRRQFIPNPGIHLLVPLQK